MENRLHRVPQDRRRSLQGLPSEGGTSCFRRVGHSLMGVRMTPAFTDAPADPNLYMCERRASCKNPATLKRRYTGGVWMYLCEDCAHPPISPRKEEPKTK